MKRSFGLALAIVLVGCAVEPVVDYVAKFEPPDDGGECSSPNCPGNSGVLGPLGPYEVSMNATEISSRGWSLYPNSFERYGSLVNNLSIAGVRLEVPDAMGNPLPQAWFVNMTFRMRHHPSAKDYNFKITAYLPVFYYTDPPPLPLPKIYAYYVWYQPTPNPTQVEWRKLCPFTKSDDGLSGDWVVFWKGDRYNPDSGEFFAHGDDVGDWFNMSCSGSADIKMLRAGIGEPVNPASTPAKRQAVLNSLMAKYCRTEERYTTLGHSLYWDGTPSKLTGPLSTPEAIWNADGAVCLDTPRLNADTDPTNDLEDGTMDCAPPPCGIKMNNWQQHGLVRTKTPLVLVAEPFP